MLSQVLAAGVLGVDGYLVEVEVDIAFGLPTEVVVGLPDTAVKESRDRIKSAVQNSGMQYPEERLTINLAPATIKKEGPTFDLPIAVGILSACGQIKKDRLEETLLLGELALDGRLRPIHGALSIASFCLKQNIPALMIPEANANEACVVQGVNVIPVKTFREAAGYLNGLIDIKPVEKKPEVLINESTRYIVDFAEVRGQWHVKRGLEVAAAGGHNLLMVGPPGAGKTMLASRLPTILPSMQLEEALETTKIHSISGKLAAGKSLVGTRPFRAPHHSISSVGLIGGGPFPKPGEISLSHNGVLFLDELPEFRRDALEVLRQPLEDRKVTISRAARSLSFPANFMLVVAMNPCPCGYFTDRNKVCRCRPLQVQKYWSRVSGPLLDRIDLHLDVPPVKAAELIDKKQKAEDSEAIRQRVRRARNIQLKRFHGTPLFTNAAMTPREIKKHCRLTAEGEKLLRQAIHQLHISARAYHKILKVARTLADLEQKEIIEPHHIAEAIQYRSLDRRFWKEGQT